MAWNEIGPVASGSTSHSLLLTASLAGYGMIGWGDRNAEFGWHLSARLQMRNQPRWRAQTDGAAGFLRSQRGLGDHLIPMRVKMGLAPPLYRKRKNEILLML